jgi:hypothetical protein
MLNVLIIGSSYSIKKIFAKKYENHNVHFASFRKLWENRSIHKFDIIILSGFHFKILNSKIIFVDNYITEYYEFINFLSKNTKKIFFISTFIPKVRSYSRTVYFYYNLNLMLLNNNNISILLFKKINDDNFNKKKIKKILDILNVKFTEPNDLIRNTSKFIVENLNSPSFFFLKIPRPKFFERFLRLLDKN